MKNFSTVLSIILLVAVVVLYILHFSGNKSSITSRTNDSTTVGELKIAYINSDTVLKYYDYLKVQKEQFEAKTKKLEGEYRNRAMGLQNEIQAYQRNRSNLTFGQDQAMQEDLGRKQQNLQMYEQTLSQQLMQDEQKLQKELYDRITAYLSSYGKEKGLMMVLKYDPSSDILYGEQALDITKEVLAGLNDEYQAEKSGNTKADTTKSKKK